MEEFVLDIGDEKRLLPVIHRERTYKIWLWDGLLYRARPPSEGQAEQDIAAGEEACHGCGVGPRWAGGDDVSEMSDSRLESSQCV
jgi:hypothetical protein